MQKKNAVTLIEFLITISVIGVIYLVLTPVMKNNMPNSSKVLLKKGYNTIEKVVYEMINDDAYADPDIGFANTTTVGGKNRFCYYFFKQLNTLELSDDNCTGKTTDGIEYEITANFGTTTDGAGKTIGDISRKATIVVTEPKDKSFTATVDYDGKINVTGDIVNMLKNPMDNR